VQLATADNNRVPPALACARSGEHGPVALEVRGAIQVLSNDRVRWAELAVGHAGTLRTLADSARANGMPHNE